MQQSVSRKIFQGVLSGFGLTIVSIFVAFVQLRLVIDFLPRSIAGIWLLFLSLGAYIAFFDLGISPTLSREISFILGGNSEEPSNQRQIADLLATCFRVFQVVAAVVFIIGLIAGMAFLWSIVPTDSIKEISIAWAVFMLGASINIIGGAAYASLYGLGDVATERISRALSQLLGLGLSYLSLYLGFGLIGLAASWVIQNLLSRAVSAYILYQRHPWLRQEKGQAQRTIVKKIAGSSLKWAATGLGAILILQTDNVIIAATLGSSAIPSYEAVAKIAMTLMTLSLYIVTSSSPFLSKAYASGDHNIVNEMLLRNVRLSMSAIVFLVSFMAAFGEQVINLWLGPGNFVGFPVLWTLLLMVLLETHHVALATATMATGRIAFVWAAIGAGVLNILLTLVLVRYWGLWGVALGTMIAQILTNNWYAPYVALKHFKIPFRDYMINVLNPILVTLIACLLFNYSMGYFFHGYTEILALPTVLILSAIFSMAWFYLFVITNPEKGYIAAKLVAYTKLRK
jgi:O-antigen/teichoic acid export membrane protein